MSKEPQEQVCERTVDGYHIWLDTHEYIGPSRCVRRCVACGKVKEVGPLSKYRQAAELHNAKQPKVPKKDFYNEKVPGVGL